MKRNYDNIINKNFNYGASYFKRLDFIFSTIENYSHKNNKRLEEIKILEVGCGKGGTTIPLSSLGCQIRAFDINENELAVLSGEIKRKNIENISISVGSAYTYDDNEKYDLIIAAEVLEHALEPLKMAKNIKKRMKENSHLILTTPNGYGPWELRNRFFYYPVVHNNLIRKIFNKPPYIEGSGFEHCQFFMKNEILNLFSKLGFKNILFGKSDSIMAALPYGQKIGNLDIKIADILPSWLASGWYFVFELQKSY